MKQDSRILITGAAGLAGSAFAEHLRDRGFTNIVPITRDDVDLRNWGNTNNLFLHAKPEYVFHTAACVYGLQGNMDNQAKSILENTQINTNVIDACHKSGVKKIVAMGTNAMYPWPAKLPFREDDLFFGRPHEGEAAYGQSKLHMLAMLEAYHTSYGLNYTCLISGNLYGPRDRFNTRTGHVLPSLVAKFYEAEHSGGDVEIWGDGSARRDFLFSADLARMVEFFMRDDVTREINIGAGCTHSISEVARYLSLISGVDYDRIHYDTSKPTGRPVCYNNLDRLDNLGVVARTPFMNGLRTTYDWYSTSTDRV